MDIKLQSTYKNNHPVCGFFIESKQVDKWLDALHALALDPMQLKIYAIPSRTANVIWGCLVLGDSSVLPEDLLQYPKALRVSEQVVILERSDIFPNLTNEDLNALFQVDEYVFHPDFDLFKLEEPIDIGDFLKIEVLELANSLRPLNDEKVSHEIMSFRFEATPAEEIEESLDQKPKRERLPQQPLTIGERLKLAFYKQFLNIENTKDGLNISVKPLGEQLSKLAKQLGINEGEVKDHILEEFKNLSERNKKEVDKLLDILEKNPEDALRYAIPLDEHGYMRGKGEAAFKMQDRGKDFSLFGNIKWGSGAGGFVDLGDDFLRLQNQYRKSAEALIKKGEYDKAAFIYLKLLKDYHTASQCLKDGGLYEKAAHVYLKFLKNETAAAGCFEEGKIYDKAIELYEKTKDFEKAGDLYALLGDRKLANISYDIVIDDYISNSKYVKASLLSKNKLNDLQKANDILLKGWHEEVDQFNCLNNYLNNLEDEEEVWNQIAYFKANEVDVRNEKIFLQVLKHEHKKRNDITHKIQNMAYTMISDMLERGLISANELLSFNKEDARLRSDTIRFQVLKNRRMKED